MNESNQAPTARDDETRTRGDTEPGTGTVTLRVRPWVPFVILFLAWPVAVQVFLGAFVLADALTQGAGVPFSGEVFALAGVLIGGVAAWWLGAGVKRAGGAGLLWTVPALWALALSVATLLRMPTSASWSVVATVWFAAFGFWLGMTRESRPANVGEQSRI